MQRLAGPRDMDDIQPSLTLARWAVIPPDHDDDHDHLLRYPPPRRFGAGGRLIVTRAAEGRAAHPL